MITTRPLDFSNLEKEVAERQVLLRSIYRVLRKKHGMTREQAEQYIFDFMLRRAKKAWAFAVAAMGRAS